MSIRYLPNDRNNLDSFASALDKARQKNRLTMSQLGEPAGAESGRVTRWTNGTEPPPDRVTCDKLAATLGTSAAELWARAAWARPKFHDDERAELVRQFEAVEAQVAALRGGLAAMTAERDNALAALHNPDIAAKVEAIVQQRTVDRLATRAGRVWAALEASVRGLAAVCPDPSQQHVPGWDRDDELLPLPGDIESATIETLVALIETARTDDGGVQLFRALHRFSMLASVPARRCLLASFAAAVEATTFPIAAPKPWESAEPSPEATTLRLDGLRCRYFLDRNLIICRAQGATEQSPPMRCEVDDDLFRAASWQVPNLTLDEYYIALCERAKARFKANGRGEQAADSDPDPLDGRE